VNFCGLLNEAALPLNGTQTQTQTQTFQQISPTQFRIAAAQRRGLRSTPDCPRPA
jgi:hypothetical protein